jgi:hypothetical protein
MEKVSIIVKIFGYEDISVMKGAIEVKFVGNFR